MKDRSTSAMVRHIQLARRARVAGEAFAFPDPEAAGMPARRLPLGGPMWIFLAAAAAAGLYLGL